MAAKKWSKASDELRNGGAGRCTTISDEGASLRQRTEVEALPRDVVSAVPTLSMGDSAMTAAARDEVEDYAPEKIAQTIPCPAAQLLQGGA